MENNSNQEKILKKLYEIIQDSEDTAARENSTWIYCEEQCDLSSEY